MAFNYSITKEQDVCVIHLQGTLLDKAQAIAMIEELTELMEEGIVKVILSMEEFQYINSTGLNVLINILTKARKQGGEAIITAVPSKINELLIITKLNMVFVVTSTLAEAMEKLK